MLNNKHKKATAGVKTPEGKAISKFNALTHGILRKSLTEYENDFYKDILKDLQVELNPQGVVEQMLIERIGICYLKLFRVQKAETEFLKNRFNPHIEVSSFNQPLEIESRVVKKGYIPKVFDNDIEILSNTYSRYETTIENRLFRALHELERAQRARKGESMLQPVVVDVNQVNSFGEKGEKDE